MALRAAALALAATLLLLVPAASAHTPVASADGQVTASIGLLNEPVVTYATTGLDVCFRTNAGTALSFGATSTEVTENANANFTVTLTAPDGQPYVDNLRGQFGKPGCLTFDNPLVLTRPGQYLVELKSKAGAVFNGTTFDVKEVAAGGAVRLQGNVTFPDESTPDVRGLEQRIAGLQGEVDGLEAQLQQMQQASATADAGDEFAPGAPAALLMLGLAGLAAALRRKA